MSIKIESTTDTAEEVTAALGKAEPKTDETEQQVANVEASGGEEEPAVEAEETAASSEESEQNDENNASESETEENPEGEETGKPKKPKKGGFQRRIAKLQAKNTALEDELEHWKSKALEAGKNKNTGDDFEEESTESSKPDPDDFEDASDYIEALVDWKAEQKLAARDEKAKAESKQAKEAEYIDGLKEAYQSKFAEYVKENPDVLEDLENVEEVKLSPAMELAILESEKGVELTAELARDPELLETIVGMKSHTAQVRALGRIEARLLKDESPTGKAEVKPKKTQAGKPLRPVKAGGGSVVKDPEKMPYREWKKWREEQLAQKRI